ncbi:Uncharacterized MFS-type transporter, partial [Arthrobacter sp. DR-2P]
GPHPDSGATGAPRAAAHGGAAERGPGFWRNRHRSHGFHRVHPRGRAVRFQCLGGCRCHGHDPRRRAGGPAACLAGRPQGTTDRTGSRAVRGPRRHGPDGARGGVRPFHPAGAWCCRDRSGYRRQPAGALRRRRPCGPRTPRQGPVRRGVGRYRRCRHRTQPHPARHRGRTGAGPSARGRTFRDCRRRPPGGEHPPFCRVAAGSAAAGQGTCPAAGRQRRPGCTEAPAGSRRQRRGGKHRGTGKARRRLAGPRAPRHPRLPHRPPGSGRRHRSPCRDGGCDVHDATAPAGTGGGAGRQPRRPHGFRRRAGDHRVHHLAAHRRDVRIVTGDGLADGQGRQGADHHDWLYPAHRGRGCRRVRPGVHGSSGGRPGPAGPGLVRSHGVRFHPARRERRPGLPGGGAGRFGHAHGRRRSRGRGSLRPGPQLDRLSGPEPVGRRGGRSRPGRGVRDRHGGPAPVSGRL